MPGKQRLILLAWALFLVLVLYQVLVNTHIRSDMSAFLPAGESEEQSLLLRELQEGPAARIWLIALHGETPEVLSAVSKDFAYRLRESGRFIQVMNGEEPLDEDSRKKLFKWRYLLNSSVDKDYFSVAHLNAALLERLDDLGSPMSSFQKELIPRDPTAAFTEWLSRQALTTGGPEYVSGVWFSRDHRRALLLVETRAAGMDLDAQQGNYDLIREQLNKAREGAAVQLIVSGTPLFALESRMRIQKESRQLSMFASLFMLLFMGLVYRSPRRVLMTALPLVGGMLSAVASVSLFFGTVHGITLAFGVTLIGVALDYPVHVLSHIHRGEQLAPAVNRIWPTLRLGVLTTLTGYVAMTLTDFTGLAQLGLFSISGLLVAALITRSLLPLIPDSRSQPEPRLLHAASFLDSRPSAVLRMIILVAVIGVLAMVAQSGKTWSNDISELSPVSAELKTQDRDLRAQMGAPEPRYLVLVSAATPERLLQKEETLEPVLAKAVASGYLAATQSAAQILPSQAAQLKRQAALPDTQTLSQRLDEALLDLPFRRELFQPFLDDVEQSRSLAPLLPADLESGSLGVRLEALVRPFHERSVGLIQLSEVSNPGALEKLLQEPGIEGLRFIDLKRATSEILDEFRLEALDRIAWASALIVAILMIGLRDPVRGLRVLLPIILAVGIAASLPILLGDRLNLFHLVSLLLVAGIGLDYALFFSRRESGADHIRTLHALLVCSISTLVVFAMLAASSIPVLHAIGLTVATGVVSAFVLSWLFARQTNHSGLL
jgi:predicted exporter